MMPIQKPRSLLQVVLFLFLSLLFLMMLGYILPHTRSKVIVVALDSMSPREVYTLVNKGKMPNFRWLIQHGYWNRLETDITSLSRVVWPIIETGRPPQINGITGTGNTAIEYRVDNMRQVPSVWDIVNQARQTSAVWNPYESFPASKITGIFVSDRWLNPILGRTTEGVYHPNSVSGELADRIAWGWENQPYPHYSSYITDGKGWNTEFKSKINFEEYFTKKTMALKVEFGGIAPLAARLSNGYNLTYYYNNTLDNFSHMLIEGGKEGESRWEALYTMCDATLGCFMDSLGPNDHLLVISDHGFNAIPAGIDHSIFIRRSDRITGEDVLTELYRSPEERPYIISVSEEPGGWRVVLATEGNPLRLRRLLRRLDLAFGDAMTDTRFEHSHNDTGISGVFGFIGPGARIHSNLEEKPHILNITPTILYLLDIAVATDMEGGIARTVFTPSYLQSHPLKTIATWGTRHAAVNSQVSEEHLAEMKTLGYIQ